MDEKINALYITKMNHDKPIMLLQKSGDRIALDIHTQFINVKSKDVTIEITIRDQFGNEIEKFQKDVSTPLTKAPINESLIGEITTFLVLDKDEVSDVNMLNFDVKINKRARGTTVLFLKENGYG